MWEYVCLRLHTGNIGFVRSENEIQRDYAQIWQVYVCGVYKIIPIEYKVNLFVQIGKNTAMPKTLTHTHTHSIVNISRSWKTYYYFRLYRYFRNESLFAVLCTRSLPLSTFKFNVRNNEISINDNNNKCVGIYRLLMAWVVCVNAMYYMQQSFAIHNTHTHPYT